MKKFLAIASILFAAAPAMAQPILLAEFERREGLSERTSLRWDISAPPFTWELLTRQSDEGAVFQAPPEFVAAANQTDNFEIVFHCFDCNGTVDRAGGDSITVDQIFAGHNSGGAGVRAGIRTAAWSQFQRLRDYKRNSNNYALEAVRWNGRRVLDQGATVWRTCA
jgi:hypothetical protein